MKIKRQNIYEVTIMGKPDKMGYSRNKTKQGGPIFLNPLDFLVLHFYPWKFWIKHSIINPENLAKLCYTTWKFQDQKQGSLEFLHGFS